MKKENLQEIKRIQKLAGIHGLLVEEEFIGLSDINMAANDMEYKKLISYEPAGYFGGDQKWFDSAEKYIDNTKNPIKLRALIAKKYNDEVMGLDPIKAKSDEEYLKIFNEE